MGRPAQGVLAGEPRQRAATSSSLDPISDVPVRLALRDIIPPIESPPDTGWVKRVKIQQPHPQRLVGPPHVSRRAVVLLPRGYAEHPALRYPVVFEADHFDVEPAFGFTTEPPSGDAPLFAQMMREAAGMRESGYDFQQGGRPTTSRA